jgi:Flp pilus assembly protein TadD/cell division septation protein DedD
MPKKFSAILLTATVLSGSLAGCSAVGSGQRAASVSEQAPQVVPRVEKALADRQFPRALTLAEGLVASSPESADYRVLLGRAYLANGRYQSARTAFADAMTLGNREVRTIISLALSDIALGNGADAYALLSENIDHLPAGDYGLAMALAGDAEEGVRALLEASRQPDATARTRQNLAFALAIGGAWGQARLIAGQDLSAKEAEKRIGQWSQALLQHDAGQRVAVMTGVLPRADDAGLPVHLALKNSSQPMMVAAAAISTAPLPEAAPSTPAVSAPASDANVVTATAVTASDTGYAPMSFAKVQSEVSEVALEHNETASPMLASSVGSVGSEVSVRDGVEATTLATVMGDIHALSDASSIAAEAQPHPAPAPVSEPAAIQAPRLVQTAERTVNLASRPQAITAVTLGASNWVVQLGAFNSAAVAREKWHTIARAQASLARFQHFYSEANIKGRVFHRVAVGGFADRKAANALCGSLTARGQACFVRLEANAGAQMARAANAGQKSSASKAPSLTNRQYAAR